MPHGVVVPVGTVLWRVHRTSRDVAEFNPVPADRHFGGGRFDSTVDDPFPFLYVAPKRSTAIAERFLRSRPFDGKPRLVRLADVRERSLAAVETTMDLRLISLVSAVDLAAVYQDDWLVQAEPAEFGKTRRWAQWLRKIGAGAHGLVWQSRRDRPHRTMILFGDNPGEVLVKPAVSPAPPPVDFGTRAGGQWLRRQLKPYRADLDGAT
jgi:hypothetical protein